LLRSSAIFTAAGIDMRRERLLGLAIFSLMAFCYEIVAAPQVATEQPAIAEPTPTPSVPPSDGPQRASYSSCRVDGPYIAMTFDDGPHPVLTPRLLDMLKARGIRATFFLIGQNAAEYPDIVRRIAAEGHEIGNHTWDHPQLTKLSPIALREEIDRTSSTIAEIIGKPVLVMRPP
jgi:peptidoglycan-N-acetylglucosamine deacetylase